MVVVARLMEFYVIRTVSIVIERASHSRQQTPKKANSFYVCQANILADVTKRKENHKINMTFQYSTTYIVLLLSLHSKSYDMFKQIDIHKNITFT